jgi:preprotein translocase subunit SecG
MVEFIIGTSIVIGVLLMLVVLAQNPKSSGSGGGLNFSGANQLMGAKRSADFFEKMTWGFIISIMVLALVANVVVDRSAGTEEFSSPNIDAAKGKNVTAPTQTLPTDSATQQTPTQTTDTTAK